MFDLPHVASRVFGRPLMISRAKLDIVLAALAPRLAGGASPPADPGSAVAPRIPNTEQGIAVVPVVGTLVSRSGYLDAASGLLSYADIGAAVAEAMNDPGVRGVILDVDSCGGEVGGLFDLVDQIKALQAAIAEMTSKIEETASAARVSVPPTSKRRPSMATHDTEQIRSEASDPPAQLSLSAQAPSLAPAADAEAVRSSPQRTTATLAPVLEPDPAMAERLRAEYAEIAAVAAQATRLGVMVEAADTMRKGVSAAALRSSALDELAARAEASHVVAVAPSSPNATESPIVRRAKQRAAAARA